ncbi:MAG: fumarylacetoacetate hydrolase family protein [Bdellovibrionales bacterium]|nr:fumarylacetoacetate hydrolase family protein [Bdellovibrionales bacterium]
MSQAIIGQIWCIGRNYSEHAKELGNDIPKEPVVFLKPASAIVSSGEVIELPSWTHDVHHEVELAFRLNEKLEPTRVAVAIDLTARDIQSELKSKGLPWAKSKAFPFSCPLSSFVEWKFEEKEILNFQLKVNSKTRQVGSSTDMLFDLSSVMTYLKGHFPIRPGDVILTGTPPGVARVQSGDLLVAEIIGKISAQWTVGHAK